MEKGDSIKIKSELQKEVSTNITIRGKKYLILTEDIEPKENMTQLTWTNTPHKENGL
jgi:hypothetical protein